MIESERALHGAGGRAPPSFCRAPSHSQAGQVGIVPAPLAGVPARVLGFPCPSDAIPPVFRQCNKLDFAPTDRPSLHFQPAARPSHHGRRRPRRAELGKRHGETAPRTWNGFACRLGSRDELPLVASERREFRRNLPVLSWRLALPHGDQSNFISQLHIFQFKNEFECSPTGMCLSVLPPPSWTARFLRPTTACCFSRRAACGGGGACALPACACGP